MIYIYFALAALLVFFSYRSLRSGIDFLKYFKQELAKPPSGYIPFTTVIAPCKGTDESLAANIGAVLAQDHPCYEVVFVVESSDDLAVPVIRSAIRTTAVPTKLIIAQKSAESGQKVENLREAVLHAEPRSEVFVFVDSDVRPANDWVRQIVGPLEDERIGAASGYRWFVGERSTFATELRSAWNASIASVQGGNTASNFCWGGSMAVRRSVFEKLDIRENWRGTLSDDLVVTRLIKAAGMPICFVPKAIVASTGTCTLRGLLEFTNRQIKITRVYAQNLWLLSFFSAGLFNLVMIVSALMLLLLRPGTLRWSLSIATIAAVAVLSTGKAWLRAKSIRLALPEQQEFLDRQLIYQLTLWLFTPALFFVNCIAALFSRRITWRGTDYEMISPVETRVL